MYRKIFYMLVATVMIQISDAATETINGISWTYTVSNGEATVGGGSSSSPAIATSTSGAITVPTTLGGMPVVGVAGFAFYNCVNLVKVVIPDGITRIGQHAFAGCSRLTSVTIPDSVTIIGSSAFASCSDSLYDTTSIRNVELVDGWVVGRGNYISNLKLNLAGVRGIVESAFNGCSALTSVTIHDSVRGIGDYAFANCSRLSKVVIGSGVTSIGNCAFFICSGLTSVTIPDSVTSIGSSAFQGCSGLTSVTIPDSVTSIGSSAFYLCSGIKDVTIPQCVCSKRMSSVFPSAYQIITNVIISSGVTSIGNNVFSGCSGLTSVTIPNSVASIGSSAFSDCSGLTSVTIPESVTSIGIRAFDGCSDSMFDETSIPGVKLVDGWVIDKVGSLSGDLNLTGARGIGNYVFSGCSGLTSVTIPDSVISIGSSAFSGCNGLTSVTIPNGVTSIGASAFAECTNLVNMTLPFIGSRRGNAGTADSLFGYIFGVTSYAGGIAINQYYSTGSQDYVTCYIPASLKTVTVTDENVLGCGAFLQCSMLENVYLWDGLTDIGRAAFRGCGGLTSVDIPSSVTNLGINAFYNCSGLTGIDIPDSVVSIGGYAFYGCSGLTHVTIPNTVAYIGEHAFDGCDGLSYGEEGFIIVSGWVFGYNNHEVRSLVIPDGVVGISSGVFADFWDLEEVVFPDSLRYIGGGAFDTCTGLDNVVIPDGVEIIGDGAFRNCTYMRNITIGEGVTSIGDEAFAGCTQLSSLSIPDNVTEIGDAAFSNCWRMLSVRLPLGLESVGVNMFSGCTSLTGVTAPTHAFTMERLFGDRYTAIASVSVSAGETEVCDGAFAGCSALTSVAMLNAITNIGNSAFASCPHLAGLELPESLDVIGTGAYSNCTALAAIVLPDGVTAIGQRAFYGCTSLANVTLSRSLVSIPDYAFHGCSGLSSMVVPASVGSLGAYIGNYFSSLYYLGNAPSYDANVYASRSRTITTYVVQGSRGWDGIPSSRDLPTSWNGYGITFWEPNRFDATFDANGGTFFDGSTAYACEQITDTGYALPPYEPTLEGFVFDGWWSDPYEGAQIKASVRVNETRDITFYAHWVGKPSSITVRFNPNGGTVEPDEGQYYSTLTYETLPVPTREHYKFAGWWTKAVGGNKVVVSSRVPTADQELFAHWTPETYTIRYNANGGTGSMADQSFVYGSAVVLRANAFSRADKSFAGWAVAADGSVVYPDGGSLGSVAAIENGVINLYAVWRGNSYAVRFDSNGGVGSMDNATFEMDEQRALPVCAFTRDGFDFAGWATSPEGEPVYSDGAVVSALTDEVNGSFVLYAVWRAFTVEVPVVTPGDGSVFVGDSCEVSITCATAGAAIYYSTTGKAPKLTDKNRYTGAFIITNTTTIYAVATRGEAMAYAVVTISKQELTLQYVLGDGGKIVVSTSPDFPWEPVVDNGAAIGYSARSALPAEDDMDSWVELSVVGSGTLSFKCKTSCEWDYTGGCEFDCLMMATNGVEIVGMRLDGIQDNWVDRAVTFSGDGEHELRLTYHKDESDFDGEDCAWLGDVRWTPAGAALPIPAVAVDADAATVNAAVDEVGFADASAVKAAIGGNAAEYNAFKAWADGVKGATGDALAGEAAVVANAHAAAAYLLGAERLFENEPTVEIGELAIADGESAGTTAMTVAVTVKDGESAVAVSAARVAAMFEATGDLGDWTGAAKLTPTVTTSGTDASGKMTFVVTPGDGTASKAFLRIKR